MPTNEIVTPFIEVTAELCDKRPTMKKGTKPVKFELRDEPDNENLLKHEKCVFQFSGEYGDLNAVFWVFLRKPCLTGPSLFGVTASCLSGSALQDFYRIKDEVHEDPDDEETEELVLEKLKRGYFKSDTPRYDQMEYLKDVRKPKDTTWRQFVSAIDFIKTSLTYFPLDVDENGKDLDDQLLSRPTSIGTFYSGLHPDRGLKN
jgi:hypothetical protein